jgi:PIN domain nuclease of toxin-antitoxin system
VEGCERVILIDTHVLVWATSEPAKLSKPALHAIHKAVDGEGVGISAISLWELSWLATRGRLETPGTVESYLAEVTSRVAIRPITIKIAVLANQLPEDYPADPCDRLIGATALAEGMTLVTKDSQIRACKQIATLW